MASCKPCARNRLARPDGCEDCGGPVSHARVRRCKRCRALAMRGEGSPFWRGGRSNKNGYVWLSGYHDHPAAVRGQVAEHVLVMAEALGRPLLSHERVHHRNGVRDDNRIENLELWSTDHPPGQRVEDKLTWAREFIEIYHPEWLRT